MRGIAAILVLLLLVPLVQAQSLTEALQECPGTLTGSTNPEQIHLQMTSQPTEMVVMWATDARTNAEVEWSSSNGEGSATGESYCYNHDVALHMAKMTDLPLGENVSYRVGQNNQWSDFYEFNTIDPSAENFEWISIADHGDSSEGMDVSEAIIADKTAQMVTISGDIAYADGEQSTWDTWFNFQQDSMVTIPWVTAVGNHENEPGYGFTPYEHRFDSDQQIESDTFWYSRNLPGIHMIFMSTEHDYDVGSEQYNWLSGDLAQANQEREERPFIIVYGHKPMYSSNSYHGSETELRIALEALYAEHGVDLVIAGHDHFYERTWPVMNELTVDEGRADGTQFARGSAPIHLVIGIAGRAAYEELDQPQPEWSAYRENSTYGWTRLVYDGDTRELKFTHYRIDGTIGDAFTLQYAPFEAAEDEGILGVPGFGTALPFLALFGAAIRRLR